MGIQTVLCSGGRMSETAAAVEIEDVYRSDATGSVDNNRRDFNRDPCQQEDGES